MCRYEYYICVCAEILKSLYLLVALCFCFWEIYFFFFPFFRCLYLITSEPQIKKKGTIFAKCCKTCFLFVITGSRQSNATLENNKIVRMQDYFVVCNLISILRNDYKLTDTMDMMHFQSLRVCCFHVSLILTHVPTIAVGLFIVV